MNKLSQLKQWLLEKRFFSTSWLAKDAQSKLEEEALAALPQETVEALLSAVNDLPTPPCEQDAVLDAVSDAIASWRKSPERSNASIVILARPVASVARVLSDCLTDETSGDLKEVLQEQSLKISLLDWVERPADVQDIKEKIRSKLGWQEEDFPAEDESGYESRAEKDAKNCDAKNEDKIHQDTKGQSASESAENSASDNSPLTLAVVPNLGWCFLRSADGLDGIDYLQELLLDDRRQFWIIGSGEVGWDYLHSTLKLGAYCGKTVRMPELSGEALQSWLAPIVQQFDIHFTNRALHQRLQESSDLLHQGLSLETLDKLRERVSREVSTTLQSSVQSIKEDIRGEDEQKAAQEDSPKRDYFNRLADISDGVSVVALQLFVQSLRYRKADPAELDGKAVKDSIVHRKRKETQLKQKAPDKKAQREETNKRPHSNKTNLQELHASSAEVPLQVPDADDNESLSLRLIATAPELPLMPNLDQGDLYLLYSLMLHGDLTVRALAKSLGDSPQIVNNQVQVLQSNQVIEQKNGVVKINPVHYPNLRRELARNNFIIEVD